MDLAKACDSSTFSALAHLHTRLLISRQTELRHGHQATSACMPTAGLKEKTGDNSSVFRVLVKTVTIQGHAREMGLQEHFIVFFKQDLWLDV